MKNNKIDKNFHHNFFKDIANIAINIDINKIEKIVKVLINLRKQSGRLFFIGVGGSAANCSHAVNDFRKLCEIDSLTPLDNTSELTANINDSGWDNSLLNHLKISKIGKKDALFVLTVGGGNLRKNVSVNLIKSINYAKKNKIKVMGICGKEDGYLQRNGDIVINVPNRNSAFVTPYSESFQSVILHSIVSDPILQIKKTKW
jgi:D-sedoheptulose 7-phosphate isomerase